MTIYLFAIAKHMKHFQMHSNGQNCLWHWKCLQQDHTPILHVGCNVYKDLWTQILHGKPIKVMESRVHIMICFPPCLIGRLRATLHSWGPLTHDIQKMWLVGQSETVQVHCTLNLEDQETWMNEKYTWHPTWHKVDNVSCCTGYCVRRRKRDMCDAKLEAVANNWLSLAPRNS